jgi:hypothetical protein
MPLTTAAKEGIFSAFDDIAIMVNTLGVTTPYDLNGDGTAVSGVAQYEYRSSGLVADKRHHHECVRIFRLIFPLPPFLRGNCLLTRKDYR